MALKTISSSRAMIFELGTILSAILRIYFSFTVNTCANFTVDFPIFFTNLSLNNDNKVMARTHQC